MIKYNQNKSIPYPVRIIASVIVLLVGVLYLASSIQYMLLQTQIPQSIHNMNSEELNGAYVTINSLRVIRDTEQGYYVEVPIANGEMISIGFWSNKETIEDISKLQVHKNFEIFKNSNGAMVPSSEYFISLDYAGTIYQGETIKIFEETGISTFSGVITQDDSNIKLLIGSLLSIYGIFVIVSTIIIMKRKPKIVNAADMQLTYSEYQLQQILNTPPIYKNIWLSPNAILILINNKVTQVNFLDMTSIDLIEQVVKYMRIYALRISDKFGKQHIQLFDSRDEAVQFINQIKKLAPHISLDSTTQHTSDIREQTQPSRYPISHEENSEIFTQNMENTKQLAEKKRKKSLNYVGLMASVGFAALIIFGVIAMFLPPMIRNIMLSSTVDAIHMLETIAYSIIIPIAVLIILSIILMVFTGFCVKRTGDYKVFALLLCVLLGSFVIILPPMLVFENIKVKDVMECFEDIDQIRSGKLIETEVYISSAADVDSEMLMYLIDDVGYDVTVIVGVPTDIEYYSGTQYYFPTVFPSEAYKNAGYEIQADYEENKMNAIKFRITHTENWKIIIGIEEIK